MPGRSVEQAPSRVDDDAAAREARLARADAAGDLEVPSGGRGRVSAGVLALLLLQLLLPLGYYTVRADRYDERFAWRMFSAIRLHQCTTEAVEVNAAGEESEALPLRRLVHVGWVSLMRRNRRDVIEAFLRRRCEEAGVREVRLRNACRSPGGEALPAQRYARVCATGAVSTPEVSLGSRESDP